jgi:hypothetical protein
MSPKHPSAYPVLSFLAALAAQVPCHILARSTSIRLLSVVTLRGSEWLRAGSNKVLSLINQPQHYTIAPCMQDHFLASTVKVILYLCM